MTSLNLNFLESMMESWMNDIFKSEINKGNIFSFLFLKEKEDEHVYKKFFMFCKNENIKITSAFN